MGPQEHAFRSGVDVIVATPGRLLDHFRQPYAKLAGLEYLVLDEADRMLDMGFLPDIRRVLRHLPAAAADAVLQRDDAAADRRRWRARCCTNPATINLERQSAPAVGITQAVYPVRAGSQVRRCSSRCSSAATMKEALVFTRTKHRANRLAEYLARRRVKARAHSRQPVAGAAHRGAGRLQGRQVPRARRDRHRRARHRRRGAGPRRQLRRAGGAGGLHPPRRPDRPRAEATGDAFTFVAPEEEGDLRAHRARDRQAAAARDACRTSTTRGGRPSDSRSRCVIGSPPCGSTRPTTARGRARRARDTPRRAAVDPNARRTSRARPIKAPVTARGGSSRGAERRRDARP